MKRELRFFTAAQVRAKQGDKPGIEGYAAVFNATSENLGWFTERIQPGAFSRAISENQDVRALVNHDPGQVIGRTKAGTLRLKEDDHGLFFDCDLPDTQVARDLAALVARGDVDGCSFGFSVRKQVWSEEKDPATGDVKIMRELVDVDLYDVGPVTFPAYPQTEVDVRALWPDGVPPEIGEHVAELRDAKARDAAAALEASRASNERDVMAMRARIAGA